MVSLHETDMKTCFVAQLHVVQRLRLLRRTACATSTAAPVPKPAVLLLAPVGLSTPEG